VLAGLSIGCAAAWAVKLAQRKNNTASILS